MKLECKIYPVLSDPSQNNSFHDVAIGKNALSNLQEGSFNFVIGQYSGTAIKSHSYNFIFGDNILGEDTDHQCIIGNDLPTLSAQQAKFFLEHFDEIYAKLLIPNGSYFKSNAFSLHQIFLMQRKLRELKHSIHV